MATVASVRSAVVSSLLVLALSSLCAVAMADEQALQPAWSIGAAAVVRDTAYREMNSRSLIVPFVRYDGEQIYSTGLGIGWRALGDRNLGVDLLLQGRLDGYDAKDSPYFAGMDDRDPSLDIGAAAHWITGIGRFEIKWLGDILDRSGGQEVALGWGALIERGKLSIYPDISLRWQNADLTSYYYGVQADEATPLRPAYTPGSALVPGIGIGMLRPLDEHWSLLGRIAHERLPGELGDSPLVDRKGATTLFFGVSYTFARTAD